MYIVRYTIYIAHSAIFTVEAFVANGKATHQQIHNGKTKIRIKYQKT